MSLRSFCLHSAHKVWHLVLAVYVDDILLTGNDLVGLLKTNEHLRRKFVTKDMGRYKYFLKIEVAHKKQCTSF